MLFKDVCICIHIKREEKQKFGRAVTSGESQERMEWRRGVQGPPRDQRRLVKLGSRHLGVYHDF